MEGSFQSVQYSRLFSVLIAFFSIKLYDKFAEIVEIAENYENRGNRGNRRNCGNNAESKICIIEVYVLEFHFEFTLYINDAIIDKQSSVN